MNVSPLSSLDAGQLLQHHQNSYYNISCDDVVEQRKLNSHFNKDFLFNSSYFGIIRFYLFIYNNATEGQFYSIIYQGYSLIKPNSLNNLNAGFPCRVDSLQAKAGRLKIE